MSRMKTVLVASCILLALILAVTGSASPEIPKKINYQGKLTDSGTGRPLVGTHNMTFRIHDDPATGSVLWSESQVVSVDSSGVFSAILGSITPIDLSFDDPVWLEVEVGGEILTPRREVVSVPFAFRAEKADQSGDADSLGGRASGDFVLKGETSIITSEMIVDGTGSNLDADMVDGLHADAFADTGHVHTGYVTEGEVGSVSGDMIADGQITDDDIAPDAAINPAKIAGTAWTSNNDGSGSGLDADMVDGLHADAFSTTGHLHDERYYTETELSTAGSINNASNPVDWTRLKNVPVGFADGTDDAGGSGDGHSLDAADGNPVDQVYVANNGGVGIGTLEPKTLLTAVFNTDNTGDTDPADGYAGSPVQGVTIGNLDASATSYAPLYFVHGGAGSGDKVAAAIASSYSGGSAGRASSFLRFWLRPWGEQDLTPVLSMRYDGNVGINAANPSMPLEIRSQGGCYASVFASGTPGSAGWTFMNEDEAWTVEVRGDSNDVFSVAQFWGGTRFAIDTDGKVGIGTITPSGKLNVVGNKIRLDDEDGTKNLQLRTDGAEVDIDANNANLFLKSNTGNTVIQGFGGNVGVRTTSPGYALQVGNLGDGTQARANAWNLLSSREYKRHIQPLTSFDYGEMLRKLVDTEVVRYVFAHDEAEVEHIGVIAEDAPPEIVTQDGKALSLSDYSAFLLAAIKAQQEQIDDLRAQVKDLQAQLSIR
jgi:hypothetical protein